VTLAEESFRVIFSFQTSSSAAALGADSACAGGSLEDANFDQAVANAAIMNLSNEEEFARAVLAGGAKDGFRPRAAGDGDFAGPLQWHARGRSLEKEE
jgi:hypothetical protein